MDECLGCGLEIPRRGSLVRRFCSNACQRSLERRERTALWLATGAAAVASEPDHYIRLHLLEEQEDRCAVCSLPRQWNGLPLTFVLDHVDGDSTSNHREKLRLVCPNCDSQLPTYKNRNRGKGRHARRVRYANGQSY